MPWILSSNSSYVQTVSDMERRFGIPDRRTQFRGLASLLLRKCDGNEMA